MKRVKVMTIFGTRPEAIKMAPLVAELRSRPALQAVCCVTAQHRQMLDSVLEIFRLAPDYDLNIMEARQTLSTITTKCLLGMEGVLEQARPDLVVFGAFDPAQGGFGSRYALHLDPALGGGVQALGGVLRQECEAALTAFFRARRAGADSPRGDG